MFYQRKKQEKKRNYSCKTVISAFKMTKKNNLVIMVSYAQDI